MTDSSFALDRFSPVGWAQPRRWLVERRLLLASWVASRTLIFATAFLLHLVGLGHAFFGRSSSAAPFGALSAWDGQWYRMVAERGYLLVSGRQSDPAFFPGFPILLALVRHAGVSPDVAGIASANLAFLAAVLVFRELSLTLLPRPAAERAAICLSLFPLGAVFSMSYPESLVLLAVSLAPLLALRGRWLAAAVVAALGALCRPEAVFVAIPLAALAWSQRHALAPRARSRALAAVAAPFAALAAFPLYLDWLLGDPLAWAHAQLAWGRAFALTGPVRALEHVPSAVGHNKWLLRDAIVLVVYLALLAYGSRARLPRTWLVAGALTILLPVFSGSFASEARFGLLAPPIYWSLALVLERVRVHRAAAAVSLVLLAASVATLPYAVP